MGDKVPLIFVKDTKRCTLGAILYRRDKALGRAQFIIDTGCPYSVLISSTQAQNCRIPISNISTEKTTSGIGGKDVKLFSVENMRLAVLSEDNKRIIFDIPELYITKEEEQRKRGMVCISTPYSVLGIDFIMDNNLRFVLDREHAYFEKLVDT